jgi:hypothetical protein
MQTEAANGEDVVVCWLYAVPVDPAASAAARRGEPNAGAMSPIRDNWATPHAASNLWRSRPGQSRASAWI